MVLVREPLDVDFFVVSKTLSQTEKALVSKYIREYKARQTRHEN